MNRMIIAIDDAGDPGLKLGKGSSDYFIIAAVYFKDNLDAEETSLKIKRLRRNLRWKPQHEFKFRKTSPEIRIKFLKTIKECNFKISLVILDKHSVIGIKEYYNDASKLYNATILKALKPFSSTLNSTHIYIDGENGNSYRRNIKAFFRQNLSKKAIKELTYRNSIDDNLIQLADMIAGAARRSVERDKDQSYLKIIKKKIIKTNLSI